MKKHSLPLLFLILALTQCSSPKNYFDFKSPNHSVEIRHPKRNPEPLFFAHENEYLNKRRDAVGLPALKLGKEGTSDAKGLAFSGGGLRSAYFNLGVLEGLQATNQLKEMDYLSTSSGGSYVGAWLVSHWDNRERTLEKLYGKNNGTFFTEPKNLLSGHSESARELRSKGFVVGEGAAAATHDGLIHLRNYVTKFAPNFVLDVAAHFKPAAGKFNLYHLIYDYRKAIERAFVAKTDESGSRELKRIALEDINPKGSKAPYLIVNASMANDEPLTLTKPSTWVDRVFKPSHLTELHQFEFTRDFCGGPEIGFVPTPAFDHSVARTSKWSYETAVQRDVPHEMSWRSSALPFAAKTKPFAVSTAVSASGAALDASGTDFRLFLDRVLKPLNLNLRYQTSNFAQSWTLPSQALLDRSREVLVDRFRPTYRSNSIYLSDAGHFDNLAVSALVHRGIRTIYVIDAGQDGDYNFSDVKKTGEKIASMACPCCGEALSWSLTPSKLKCHLTCEDRGGIRHKAMSDFIVRSRIKGGCGGYLAEVIYVKASYLSKFADEDPGLKQYAKCFAQTDKHFPHESTFHVTPYSEEMFNAYRALGAFAARCLKSGKHVTTIY